MPQHKLPLQHGPQDALLLDCSRSYFNNVGYVRTCDFQQELKDITATNTAALGTTVHFTIDRAADLLGQIDLVVNFTCTSAAGKHNALVDGFGYAMIDTIKFTVGTNEIQEIQGEWLAIENALFRDKDFRYDDLVLLDNSAITENSDGTVASTVHKRLVKDSASKKFELIVPLSTFFSKHPSQFLPLAAVAGCNDIKVAVKFRPQDDLFFEHGKDNSATATDYDTAILKANSMTVSDFKAVLRAHYYHVPGPEANALISKEHVRLIKGQQRLKHHIVKGSDIASNLNTKHRVSINLSFLHPVQELIFTLRAGNDLNGANNVGRAYFAYQGRPIPDDEDKTYQSEVGSNLANPQVAPGTADGVELVDWNLVLNGNSYHPERITRQYTQKRILPMVHSEGFTDKLVSAGGTPEIYVVPFAMNPEGHNPSGHLNFSKVSYSKLELDLYAKTGFAASTFGDLYIDIWAVYYNWTQIKDGRVVNSFQ